MSQERSLTDVRIRNLDPDTAQALDGLANGEGRTVEAYLRELIKDAVRARVRDFPIASEWVKCGFHSVYELQPGRQYIAQAGSREFRITLTRSITGDEPEWNTEIEESTLIDLGERDVLMWTRAANVPQRLVGDTPAMAIRDAMRWVADYAGVDPVSRARRGKRDVSPRFGAIIDELDNYIKGEKTYPRDGMVIYHTAEHDIYINEIDDKRGAVMVYPSGGSWSITDGRADYFQLNQSGTSTIVECLTRLKAISRKHNIQ